MTKAFTEFFTLNYLKETVEVHHLNQLVTNKRSSTNVTKIYHLIFHKIEGEKIHNINYYDLLPLILWSNKATERILIDFFNLNRNLFYQMPRAISF